MIVLSRDKSPLVFQFWKYSQGGKSDEYSGRGMITVLCLTKKSGTSNNVRAGALSQCKRHTMFLEDLLARTDNASRYCN